MKKRPTWATIVGVLGIIFACFGIIGAGYEIMMPKMMEMQKEMFSQMEKIQKKAAEGRNSGNAADEEFLEIAKSIQKMWETPEWFQVWAITTGLVKLAISGLALFVYICMLQIKPFSIKLFYWVAGLNIGLAVFKAMIMLSTMSFFAMAMSFGGFFGIVINVVLLIVVALGNKEPFYQDAVSSA